MGTHLRRFLLVLVVLFLLTPPGGARQTAVELRFTPETAADQEAAGRYRAIWQEEGARIIRVLEARTGLPFKETIIDVTVVEAASSSGFGSRPMRLRSSYSETTKRATLIHELGHRMHGHLFHREEEDHPYLFLYLYDVWVQLYGQEFADGEVAVESRRRGIYDYEGAWTKALSLSAAERLAAWKAFVASR